MCHTKQMKNRLAIYAVFGFGIVMIAATIGLRKWHKRDTCIDSVRSFLYSSLPPLLTRENLVMRCISNNVASATIFMTDTHGVCLCYDIDSRFYCIQQTGQLMCFDDVSTAKLVLRPKCEEVLYNRDKTIPQSPDGISLWVQSVIKGKER